jgi:teichuronic acid biosynthesis glycosyltransferase TuaC
MLCPMRVLLVTNLYPTPRTPRRGRFVADQVDALRDLGVELELFTFPLGAAAYPRATARLRRLLRRESFDLIHAHYGLCGWCAALAGARPLIVTFHGTDVRHRLVGPMSRRLARRIDLIAAASRSLYEEEGERRGLPAVPGQSAVLPCGAQLERFRPVPRADARERIGLDPNGRYLFFPADPDRAVKRHDRAEEVARLAGAKLLIAGEVEPEAMNDRYNAASATVVTSDSEGFGMATIESLACRVPVLSTPVGIAPFALAGIEGCLAAPFDARSWSEFARRHLDAPDPRVDGSGSGAQFSAQRMAARVRAAYDEVAGWHSSGPIP